MVYHRSGRELQFLKSGALEREFRGLLRDPRRYRRACAFVEFLDRVLTGEEPAEELYDFAVRALDVLETAPPEALSELFRGMQLRVAALLGYAPRLDRCLRCGRAVGTETGPEPGREAPAEDGADRSVDGRGWLFLPAEGGVACPSCAALLDPAGVGLRLTPRALRRLRAMALGSSRPAAAAALVRDASVEEPLPPGAPRGPAAAAPAGWIRVLDRLVEDFLRYHFDTYRGLRSLAVELPREQREA